MSSDLLWRIGVSTCCACKMLVPNSHSPEITRILRSFKFFRMHLPFLLHSINFKVDCCTTVTLSSVFTVILGLDLVLFKFRHGSYFWYFNTCFEWLFYLVADVGEMQF